MSTTDPFNYEIEMPPLEKYGSDGEDTQQSDTITEEHNLTPSTAFLLAEAAQERGDFEAQKSWLQYYDRQLKSQCQSLLQSLSVERLRAYFGGKFSP